MVTEFSDAAFAMNVGDISQPIKTTFGYHIIQVLGHEQNRSLDASALEQKKSAALTDWLEQSRLQAKIDRFYKDEYVPVEVKRMLAEFQQPAP